MNGRWQWRGVPKFLRYRHRGSRKLKQLTVEVLEPRQLLSVSWISKTSGNWNLGSNWSTGTVPGPGDDVVINVFGASPTVTISSNVESVHSITTDDPLDISGGGLTVAASSTISGGLAMTGGSLTAGGSGVTFTVTGPTTVSSANLYAQDGATLSFPQLGHLNPKTHSA
jgi:phage baseplate assembly protein gpV